MEDFDWEAAAAAMENISLLEDATRIQRNQNPLKEIPCQNAHSFQSGVGLRPKIHAKLQQKTLLSFVRNTNEQSSLSTGVKSLLRNSSEPNPESISDMGKVQINLDAAKTWVYPVNVPMRDYQYSIAQTALFSNTLVSLPTGLGKTLIAAVVMYNFFRWFPTGKIVFSAPSRPLVLQQIEACHNSVGIPQEYTIDMTGQMNPSQRSTCWHSKRVFFVTPQVFEKDIQSGSCPMDDLVCLVVDEAHRAMGNYAYCVVVRKLMEASVRLRILALTATPGSKQVTVQSVVDNLRISCLEYRNENDPDVKPFVHNRKLELLQVPMDSDSIKIKDLLIDVLQPLVNRLCGFGVFYSNDAARLTPYEFLMAREKFRQAPPPGLDPRQYGEVEACFGATITLCHVVKLLFSHGIQPAFEMLKKRLESGPFGRLMGRNENLQDVKLLMQKYLSKGASSPKLKKLLELIADHFGSNDPCETRVIIFTNFRDSVKDIIEAMKTLGDIVKATEFIGQSSGTSLKGQSQKVQQSVLQKFRTGGFNTIVATSIAEEGLDIMEVDFVICFDANVSPLRMIQRMGRTGRKRDGRVVILASEGSEAQGFLKKQAKNKVLTKHLHNGGVHSFNFHSSPRMVPHSIKPEPQFVELSIAKFVPRVKSKVKALQLQDPVSADLSPEDFLLLRRYLNPEKVDDDGNGWMPSLIAFPHCQLLPTQVHCVRHSVRTISMLIDTLQALHENHIRETDDNKACRVSSDNIYLNSKNDQPGDQGHAENESDNWNQHVYESLDPSPKVSLPSPSSNKLDDSSLLYDHQPSNAKSLFGTILEDGSITNPPSLKSQDPIGDDTTIENMSVNCLSTDEVGVLVIDKCFKTSSEFHQSDAFDSIEELVRPSARDSSTHHSDRDDLDGHNGKAKALASAFGDSMYSEGFVSVDSSGYVQICSPPKLPFESLFSKLLDTGVTANRLSALTDQNDLSKPRGQTLSHSLNEEQIVKPSVSDRTPSKACLGSLTPEAKACHIVKSTPASKVSQSSLHDHVNACECSIGDDSPRVCTLAEQGLVPLSPDLASSCLSPVGHTVDRRKFSGNDVDEVCSTPEPLQGSTLPSVAEHCDKSENQISSTHYKKTIDIDLTQSFSEIKVSCGENEAAKPIMNSETPAISDGSNWNQPLPATCSIQKPKQFRRLRKAREASKRISQKHQPFECLDRCQGDKKICTPEQIDKSTRRQKLQFGAALLVDEEAEVSSSEEVSTDENDDDDEQGSLKDFIDDRVQPTVRASPGVDEPIDMLAVYRKSLLTPSSLDEHSLPWMRRLLHIRTPLSGDSNFTTSDCCESILSASCHGSREIPPSSRKCTGYLQELLETPGLINSAPKEPPRAKISQSSLASGQPLITKGKERKRKLSFQHEQTIASIFSAQLDDDLFAGLDLDALEVEAVERFRANPQGQSTSQARVATVEVVPTFNKNRDMYSTSEEDLDLIPSFNLGIDC